MLPVAPTTCLVPTSKPPEAERPAFQVLSPDPERARELAAATGLHPIVAQVLLHRGIATPDAVRRFLSPETDSDEAAPHLTDMDAAADIVASAIEAEELICIHGDYDCDGVSATALLAAFLQDVGAPCIWYIPHRIDEGYGISAEGVQHAARSGARVLVTVDCGTSSPAEVALARELGLKVVVTDHHRLPERHAEPHALVNPQREAGPHPLKRLSGVGVALKLVEAVGERLGLDDVATEYLDIATLGTVGDVMPLLGENRRLVARGLARMREDPRPGVAALMEAAGVKMPVTARDIAFRVVPPINASGRLDRADRAVELLLETDPDRARELADELVGLNAERRRIEAELTAAVRQEVLRQNRWQEDGFILAGGEGWHRGVVGIVASRLLDEFGVPALVVSIEGDEARGSARAPLGMDLFACLCQCAAVLTHYGGHPRAGGFSLEAGNMPAFHEMLREAIAAQAGSARPLRQVDAEVALSDLTVELAAELERLAPFGEANAEPLFAIRNVRACFAEQLKSQHARFQVRQDGLSLKAIRFGTPDAPAPLPDTTHPISLLAHVERDTWTDPPRVQLRAVAVEGAPVEAARPRRVAVDGVLHLRQLAASAGVPVVGLVRTPAQARDLAGRFALGSVAELLMLPPGEPGVLAFGALRQDDARLTGHVAVLLVPPPSRAHLEEPFYRRAGEVHMCFGAATLAQEAAFYEAATMTQPRLEALWRALRAALREGAEVSAAALQARIAGVAVNRVSVEAGLRIFEEIGLLARDPLRLQEGRRGELAESPTWQRMSRLHLLFEEVQADYTNSEEAAACRP